MGSKYISGKYYYELTKSGLVFGNIITVIAGFALGSHGHHINIFLLFATLVGISLVIASGCVFNNYIDRDIDIRMERTKHRALVAKKISPRSAMIFGAILGITGFAVLVVFTNILAIASAVIGFFFYIFVYTIWTKRRSVYGTFAGAIAGATPPVVGYCAANGKFDMAALILFLIVVTWQMPHFFAIAIRRRGDYAAAGIPVMPVSRGIHRAKISMSIYIAEFIIAASLLFVFGYMGYWYLGIVILLGFLWLGICIRGFYIKKDEENTAWARTMFLFSLIVMMITFITITIEALFAVIHCL